MLGEVVEEEGRIVAHDAGARGGDQVGKYGQLNGNAISATPPP